MGKLMHDPQIQHFSHPHPLELTSLQNQPQLSLTPQPCSGCKLQLSGYVYTCRTCNFTLHVSCTQFPQVITHPSHPINHILNLLPTAAYPGGEFNCDACNRRGNGFSYHCSHCDFDLHVDCASKPISVSHPFHAHPLYLTFSSPYQSQGFSCDVCRKIGSKQWLYRCVDCDFDVHLDCATAAPPPRPQPLPPPLQHHHSFPAASATTNLNQFQSPVAATYGNHYYMHSASTNGQYMQNASNPANNQFQSYQSTSIGTNGNQYMQNAGNPANNQFQSYQSTSGNDFGNAVMTGLVEGAAQQVGQSLMQGIIGGGGGNGGGGGGDGSGDSSSILNSSFGDSDTQY